MPARFYLSQIVGTGSEGDPRRPVVYDSLPALGLNTRMGVQDAPNGAWALVRVDTADHGPLQGVAGVEPLFPAGALTTRLSDVPIAERTRILGVLNTRLGLGLQLGTAPLIASNTVADVMRWVGRRREPGFGEGGL